MVKTTFTQTSGHDTNSRFIGAHLVSRASGPLEAGNADLSGRAEPPAESGHESATLGNAARYMHT